MATSIDITSLIGAYNVRDFGAYGTGNQSDAAAFARAFAHVAGQSPANGIIFVPPGTYRMDSALSLISNITLLGAGPSSSLILGPSTYDYILQGESVSNVRLVNLHLDGNRSGNTAANYHGLYLYQCNDIWLEGVEVTAAGADGIYVDSCNRVRGNGVLAYSNGGHGIAFWFSEDCGLENASAYDNCQVTTAGNADGISLQFFAAYNSFVNCAAYERSRGGQRQGYGLREASANGCFRNCVMGGSYQGNRTGRVSIESGDTVCVTPDLVQIPAGVLIQP